MYRNMDDQKTAKAKIAAGDYISFRANAGAGAPVVSGTVTFRNSEAISVLFEVDGKSDAAQTFNLSDIVLVEE